MHILPPTLATSKIVSRKKDLRSIEPLESRIAPAYAASLSGSAATLAGDASTDHLVIDVSGGNLEYSINGGAFSSDWDTSAPGIQTLAAAAASSVSITVSSGAGSSVTLGTAAGPASQLLALFSVGASAGAHNSLAIDDSGSTTQNTYMLNTVSGLISATGINVHESASAFLDGVVLKGSSATGDTFNIPQTLATEPVAVLGGNSGVFHVGANGFISLASLVTIASTGGSTLTLDDHNDTSTSTITIDKQSGDVNAPFEVTGSGSGLHFNSGFSALNLTGGVNGTSGVTFNVDNTPSSTTTTITGGPNKNFFNLGNSNLDNLAGPVVIHGGASLADVLTLDDSKANFNDTYTVTSAAVSRVNVSVSYDGLGALTLNAENTLASNGNNTININSTAASVITTINGLGGSDTINVNGTATTGTLNINTGAGGSTINILANSATVNVTSGGADLVNIGSIGNAGSLDSILAPINIVNPTHLDTIALHDDNSAVSKTFTFSANSGTESIAATGLGVISFVAADTTSLSIAGGNGDDIFNVAVTSSVPTTIIGGSGHNTVNAGANGALAGITGYLAVSDPTGVMTLVLDDHNDTSHGVATLDKLSGITDTPFEITGLAPATIAYGSGVSTLNISGGTNGANGVDFEILATQAGTKTTITSGSQVNLFNLSKSSATDGLDNLPGAIVIHGGGAGDSINLNDQGADFDDDYTLTSTTVSRLVFGGLTFDGVSNLTLFAETLVGTTHGDNNINVNSTAAGVHTTIYGDGGFDFITIGNGNLSAVAGPVTVYGGDGYDTVAIHDDNNSTATTYTVTSTTVTAPNFGGVTYDNTFEIVAVFGGSAGNVFNISSTAAGVPVTLNGGAGNDTFNLNHAGGNGLGALGGSVIVNGGGGADALNLYGAGTEAAKWSPSGSASNSGAFGLHDAITATYHAVGNVLLSNVASLAFITPAGNNGYTLDDAGGSASLAGTSGSATHALSFTGIPSVTLDLATNAAAADVNAVTFKSLNGESALQNLTVNSVLGQNTVNVNVANLSLPAAGGSFKWSAGAGADTLKATAGTSMTLSNSSLSYSSGGILSLSNVETANLTDTVGGNSFTITGWTGVGSLSDTATPGDTVIDSEDLNFTLTDGSLQRTNLPAITLTHVTAAKLTAQSSSDSFNVSGWTGSGSLTGVGSNSVTAAKDAGYTLSNTGLSATDGLNLTLSGIGFASLSDTGGGRTFTITGWTGGASLTGIKGIGSGDTLVDTENLSFVLSNTALARTGLPSIALSGFFAANLTALAATNSFTVDGWTQASGTLTGVGGNTVQAAKNADFVLSDNELLSDDSMHLTLVGIGNANLTSIGSSHSFAVSDWTGGGLLRGEGGSADSVYAANAADFTLTNGALVRTGPSSSSFASLQLQDVEVADLEDTDSGAGAAHTFDVSGWTGKGSLVGFSGHGDSIHSNKNADAVLANGGLYTSDHMFVTLANIPNATLGAGTDTQPHTLDARSFDSGAFASIGKLTLVGGGGNDVLIAGLGTNILKGGVLSDRFVLSGQSVSDTLIASSASQAAAAAQIARHPILKVNGFEQRDLIDYGNDTSGTGVTVDLRKATQNVKTPAAPGATGNLILQNADGTFGLFADLIGSQYNDKLTGNKLSNIIYFGGGKTTKDTLAGGGVPKHGKHDYLIGNKHTKFLPPTPGSGEINSLYRKGDPFGLVTPIPISSDIMSAIIAAGDTSDPYITFSTLFNF